MADHVGRSGNDGRRSIATHGASENGCPYGSIAIVAVACDTTPV